MIPQPTKTGEVLREKGLAPPQPAGPRWRHAWRLISCYWASRDWKFAWFALIVLIISQFADAYLILALNRWQKNFFDSVQQSDAAQFGWLVMLFVGITALQVGQFLFANFLRQLLSIRWRAFLTERYVDRWMSHNRYSEIERLRLIDNPDQRIQEDINRLTDVDGVTGTRSPLSIALDVLGTTATAVAMIYVLLETAEPIRLSLLGWRVSIPGSTIWYAALYALVTSVLISFLGRPFIRAQMRQQHREADFRAGLIHVRRNAAQIGLAGALSIERNALRDAFAMLKRNYYSVIGTRMAVNAAQQFFQRISGILPLFLLVPRFFAGTMTFGQVMAGRDAFTRLAGDLSIFVMYYQTIGEQISFINRLKALDDAIEDARPRGIGLTVGTPGAVVIATSALLLRKPHGEPLADVGDWTVRSGERWAVRGPSGAGKSTLVRALAGLWPDGAGSVAIARDTHTMFVPQRLYLPLGTLKAGLCFPDMPDAHDDAAIVALLDRVRLGHLAVDLHAARMWQEELSPGEQQRVALARILLQRPTLLVLDEATSALDGDNARHFYACIREAMPDATILSVVHDETLLRHHTHTLSIVHGCAQPERIPGDGA
ncbi:ABC transporter ATP-binding protein/permease [Sphingomonas sp. CLY1604]|uniref:ABC transporter ATP-binding protein/permease n=1 Tax=Sphingomonas sp. CLY1604 TaxID=3457786 RepID=UPI003FD76485